LVETKVQDVAMPLYFVQLRVLAEPKKTLIYVCRAENGNAFLKANFKHLFFSNAHNNNAYYAM
jgi:hypothetical protein